MGLTVCRAMRVLCVATDAESLTTLRLSTTAAEWELTPGATNETDALGVIDAERPQAVVAFGPYEGLVELVRERFPAMRIVTDRETPGATVVATSIDEVRGSVLGMPRPGGPVGG